MTFREWVRKMAWLLTCPGTIGFLLLFFGSGVLRMRRDASLFVPSLVRRLITRKPSANGALRKKLTVPVFMEALEARQMLSAAIQNPIADLNVTAGTTTRTVSLANLFKDDAINGTVVEFIFTNVNTLPTKVNVELFDAVTVETVKNFLKYVTANRFDATFIHRSVQNFVVQGGGFKTTFANVETYDPVINEAYYSNRRGTIAMAKSPGNPNSATSQWFFNVGDNGGSSPDGLDYQNGGFTVFGRVLGNGMATIDKINQVPTFNAGGAYANLPLANYTFPNAIQQNNLVGVQDISIRKEVQPSQAVSSNTGLVTTSFDANGNLKLDFVAGASGVANITITGTSADGSTTTDTFSVSVLASGASPTANSGTVNIDFARPTNITEKLFGLTSGAVRNTLTILSQPTNGSLILNPATQQVTYVPNAGYLGNDSFTYTVRNSAGFLSSTGTVTLSNAPVVTLGPGATDLHEVIFTNAAGKQFNIKYQSGAMAQIKFTGSPTGLTVYENNVAVLQGTNLGVEFLGVLDATATTAVSSSAPGTVSATLGANGATLGLSSGVFGAATISVTATTSTGSQTGQYVVTVINDIAPVVNNATITAEFNRTKNITDQMFALMSDSDGTINKSTFRVVRQPIKGKLFFDAKTQQIVYLPAQGFSGTESFTYTVLDDKNVVSNLGTISFTVEKAITLSSEPGGIRQIVFTENDNTRVTVTLSGPGSVKMTFGGTLNSFSISGQIGSLAGSTIAITAMAITGTDSTSAVTISTQGGTTAGTAVTGVTVAQDLGTFWAPTTNIGASGFIASAGADIGTLRVSDILTDADVTLPGANAGMVVIARNVGTNVDMNINSQANYVKTRSWLGGNLNALGLSAFYVTGFPTGTAAVAASGMRLTTGTAAQTTRWVLYGSGLSATGGANLAGAVNQFAILGNTLAGSVIAIGGDVNKFLITGNLLGTLTISGDVPTLKILGNTTSAQMNLNTAGTILVGGSVTDSTIKATTSIQAFFASQMVNSSLLVSVSTVDPTDKLPTSSEGFTGQLGFLGFVGLSSGATAGSFQDSRIAAKTIDEIRLGNVKSNNAGEGFGVAGKVFTGDIRLTILEDGKSATIDTPDNQADANAQILAQSITKRDLILRVTI
jgi:cyclophilin family peptidyl-prolyl cis-trans isomerase